MADNGELREDLKVPDGELGGQLRSDFDSGKELLVRLYSKRSKTKSSTQFLALNPATIISLIRYHFFVKIRIDRPIIDLFNVEKSSV